MNDLLASYENGGTRISLHASGTKLREIFDESVPPALPEQMDLKITDWCDAGCAWCHEGSTRRGRHGDVDAMIDLLRPLPAGVEIAIGGGDPLSHPRFEHLVAGLRAIGLIPSVTVNGRHVERHREHLEALIGKGQLFGLGVSYHERFPDWDYPHMVHHMIAGVDDPMVLMDTPPRKILVLGYKEWGRGSKFLARRPARVQALIERWYRYLPLLAQRHHLSFDTLSVSQLQPRRLFRDPALFDRRFMGEEGAYSLYVDGVTQTFAVSSYAPDRHSWTDIRDMFATVRASTSQKET